LLIAYASDCDGNFEIYIMDADGQNKRRLTHNSDNDSSPTWSPDGSQIAFVSMGDDKNHTNVKLIDLDGENISQLAEFDSYVRSVTWSPDGLHFLLELGSIDSSEIYVMDADGKNVRNLTNNENIADGAPAWSPDSLQIAFHSYRDVYHCWHIYMMDADGSNVKRVSNEDDCDFEPAWSPDGQYLAFKSFRNITDDIYVTKTDGSEVFRLTTDAMGYFEPDWRPNP
jgi:Tol biopolymer transport system component